MVLRALQVKKNGYRAGRDRYRIQAVCLTHLKQSDSKNLISRKLQDLGPEKVYTEPGRSNG